MTRTLTALTLVLMSSPLAFATVTEWSGRTAGTDYTITNGIHVEILANGTFKFQSEDVNNNLADIGSITVANGVTGTVTVFIERDTNDNMPGATNVGEINLTNDQGASLVGNLAELRITGDLGSLAPTVIRNLTGVTRLNDSLDAITINNDLSGDITADVMGIITIGRSLTTAGSIVANVAGDIAGSAYIFAVSPDSNGNGVMDVCDCPGDLNADGLVDLEDLVVQLANFGQTMGATFADGDLDFDHDVDLSDLATMLGAFGNACP